MRHFGYVNQKTPILLLGFNKANSTIMYVELESLSPDEIQWLGDFIARNYKRETLAVPLNMETMRNGASAFQHFIRESRTTEQYNVHMIDKDQCIQWFKVHSNYVNRDIDHPLVKMIEQKLAAPSAPAAAPDALGGEEAIHPLLETLKSIQGDPRVAKLFHSDDEASDTPEPAVKKSSPAISPGLETRLSDMEKQLKLIAKELKRLSKAKVES